MRSSRDYGSLEQAAAWQVELPAGGRSWRCWRDAATRTRCRPLDVYEVKGKVLLGDGKPLGTGLDLLRAQGRPARHARAARSPRTGRSPWSRAVRDEEAPPGEYKVRIDAPQLSGPRIPRSPPFPDKYSDEDSSSLVVTVRAGANHLDPFVLK